MFAVWHVSRSNMLAAWSVERRFIRSQVGAFFMDHPHCGLGLGEAES